MAWATVVQRFGLTTARRVARPHWHGQPVELLMLPADLRTGEPGFVDELNAGSIGLSSISLPLGDKHLYDIRPPSDAFATELYGFGWLNHLSATRNQYARDLARAMLLDWAALGQKRPPLADTTAVTARRALSWLAHVDVALHDADADDYDRILAALVVDLQRLEAALKRPTERPHHLACLIALLELELCTVGSPKRRATLEERLTEELGYHLALDGTPKSRNPADAIALLLDLMPLLALYSSGSQAAPDSLAQAVPRLQQWLAFLRSGDGTIGRFNGMGATPRDTLATLLSINAPGDSGTSPFGGYARLDAGKTVVLMDTGAPPPRVAQAGASSALAFELSVGRSPLIVNSGVGIDGNWADGTAATLAFAAGVAPRVTRMESTSPLVSAGEAVHGTADDIRHYRRIALAADGRRLDGLDKVSFAASAVDNASSPLALHFPLHPSVRVDKLGADAARLTAENGMRLELRCEAATLSIEPAAYRAIRAGSMPTLQAVFRAHAPAGGEFPWSIAVTT